MSRADSITVTDSRPIGLGRRLKSNFIWSFISLASTRGLMFLTIIYLARVLGVKNFGLFTVAQTITFYFWLAVELGTTMYGIREIAKDKENPEAIVNPLLGLRLAMGSVVFVMLVVFLYFSGFGREQVMVGLGCGLYLLTYAANTEWVFKGVEKFKYIVFGSGVSSVLFLLGAVLLVRSEEDAVAASVVWSLSFLFGSAALIHLLHRLGIRPRPEFNAGKWILHLRESIYFTLSGGLLILYQYMPILFLTAYFTSYEVGLFAAPYKIVITICNAGAMLPMAFYPVFAETYVNDREKFNKAHNRLQTIMLALGIPFAVIGMFLSDTLVRLLLGPEYSASVDIFKYLVWLVPLFYLRYTYGSVLLAINMQRQTLWSTAPTAVFITVMCYLYRDGLDIMIASIVLAGESLTILLYIIAINYYRKDRTS